MRAISVRQRLGKSETTSRINSISVGKKRRPLKINGRVLLGWTNRRKSNHFAHYRRVAEEFSETVGIDPWLIDPIFRNCGHIDFQKREGEDCLASFVDEVLILISKKYREYGIEEEPFVVVKADSGTYGMAIMSVRSPAEVSHS